MENQFSTYQPNKTRDEINSLLKEINFFDKSPSELNTQVNEILFKYPEFDLQLPR